MREKFNADRLPTTVFVTFALMVIWLLLTADFRPANWLVGLVFGLAAWLITPLDERPATSASKIPPLNPLRLLRFGIFFVYTIIEANFQMAVAVIRTFNTTDHLKPAILAYPTRLRRAREITLLANWITLTPGTLTLEVTPDGRTLYIHTYNMGDSRADFVASIAKFERQIEELFY